MRIKLFLLILFFSLSFTQNTNQWKLSVQMWTFHISNFEDALNRVDSCGIHYIEIYPGQKINSLSNDVIGPSLSEDKIEQLKKSIAVHPIKVISYGVVTCDKREEWESHFQFARDMNISVITAEPNKEDLDFVNMLAGKYKIKVAIHDHPKPSLYWHPDSVLQALQNRSNMGVCADIGHWVRNGLNVTDCLKKLRGHIIELHFKDVLPDLNDKNNFAGYVDVDLGKGLCNIETVLKELKYQNFNGFFTMEHEANWCCNVQDLIINKKYYLKKMKT